MERRLLLVFALTFLVIVLFQPILKKYLPQSPAPAQQPQGQIQTSPQTAAINRARATQPSVPVLNAGATKQAASESETVIENDLYRITFTNRGAQVKSWILKRFDNDAQNGPLDLVNAEAAAKFGYPLSLWTYDEGLRGRLSSALYVGSRQGSQTSPTDVTFEYSDHDLSVHKTFRFTDSYVVSVETSVVYKGVEVGALPAW